MTRVEVGGRLSNNKGLNVPDVVVPMAALTDKDRRDLAFALEQNCDWIALCFVQRPDDVAEARRLIGDKAALLAKIEKPAAMERLDEIMELADAVMVARGDLGVELPPEAVPPAQKRIVESARRLGRPVVVATQMLESMIVAPTPTRAEVSDVATAIYDGADAMMLSAESAAGAWPEESVAMMDRIAISVEGDPAYLARVHFMETRPTPPPPTRWPRRRPASPAPCRPPPWSASPHRARPPGASPASVRRADPRADAQARRRRGGWACSGARTPSTRATWRISRRWWPRPSAWRCAHHIAKGGDAIMIMAGVPFGTPGSTNVLHVVRLVGDELKGHSA